MLEFFLHLLSWSALLWLSIEENWTAKEAHTAVQQALSPYLRHSWRQRASWGTIASFIQARGDVHTSSPITEKRFLALLQHIAGNSPYLSAPRGCSFLPEHIHVVYKIALHVQDEVCMSATQPAAMTVQISLDPNWQYIKDSHQNRVLNYIYYSTGIKLEPPSNHCFTLGIMCALTHVTDAKRYLASFVPHSKGIFPHSKGALAMCIICKPSILSHRPILLYSQETYCEQLSEALVSAMRSCVRASG